jgi:hypothetical protein
MRFLMDKFEAAKDKAKDDAKGGAPYQRRTYDAKSLLKVTEFLIQEDRAFYSDQNKSDPNAQLEELERRPAPTNLDKDLRELQERREWRNR